MNQAILNYYECLSIYCDKLGHIDSDTDSNDEEKLKKETLKNKIFNYNFEGN